MASKKMSLRAIGNRIAEMRYVKGFTQQQLADKADLSLIYIGSIEQGKRRGSLFTYEKIVTALGFTMNDLVSNDFSYPTSGPLPNEISKALAAFDQNEQEAVLQLLNALVNVIHLLHGD